MRLLTKVRSLAAFAGATLLISALATPAARGATSPSGTAKITLNGQTRALPAGLVNKIKSGHPETLTPAEQAQLMTPAPNSAPAQPGATSPNLVTHKASPKLVTHKASGPHPQPQDVGRCSGIVCIEVQSSGGKGPFIIEWNSQWYQPSNYYSCDTVWDWWGNMSFYRYSNTACGYGPDYSYWTPYRNLATGNAQTYYTATSGPNSPTVRFSIS